MWYDEIDRPMNEQDEPEFPEPVKMWINSPEGQRYLDNWYQAGYDEGYDNGWYAGNQHTGDDDETAG